MTRANAVRTALKGDDRTALTWRTRIAEQDVVPKVACYCRVSSVKQANEDTIAVQLKTVEGLRLKHFGDGQQFVGTFADEGYTLESFEQGRRFWALMDLVRAGEVNQIIVASENRIFRGASGKLRGMINDVLREGRVTLITPEGANLFKQTATTDRIRTAVTQELGTINKIELVRTLQTARRARLQEERQFRPAAHPFGYRIDVSREGSSKRKTVRYVVHEAEARIVADVFALYIGQRPEHIGAPDNASGGMGAARIAEFLNASGLTKETYIQSLQPGHRDNVRMHFTAMGITHMLRNPAYAGRAVVYFHETGSMATYEADALLQTIDVPPIISEETFQAADALRAARSEDVSLRFKRSAQGANWLHGLLLCQSCGWPMRGVTASNGERYYTCPRKKLKGDGEQHRTVRASDVEEPLKRRLMEVFSKNFSPSQFLAAIRTNTAEDEGATAKERTLLEKQLSDAKGKLGRLVDGFTDGIIDRDLYVAKKKSLDFSIRTVGDRIATIDAIAGSDEAKRIGEKFRLKQLQEVLARVSANTDYTAAMLRLITKYTIQAISMPASPVVLAGLSDDELRGLLASGRIVPKNLTDAGWSWRRIARLGKSGRKTALDFDLNVTWVTGETETVVLA